MYSIYSIDDKILIKPDDLNTKGPEVSSSSEYFYEDVIIEKVREKYIGKVLFNHGIVVSMKRLVIKNNLIVEIEGVINVEYESDLIVFKPQYGDILFGKIISSDKNFITVDCDIIKVKVPSAQLMTPHFFDENDKVWYWKYSDHNLYYDKGEEVRLKVIEVNFKKKEIKINEIDTSNQESIVVPQQEIGLDQVIEILCCVNIEGLGPLKWWDKY